MVTWLAHTGVRGWWRGPGGVRAGWRIAAFLALVIAVLLAAAFLTPRSWLVALMPRNGVVTPGFMLLNELLLLVPVLVASWVMQRLEGRGFLSCGLREPRCLLRLGQGFGAGLVLISAVTLAVVASGHAHLAWGGLSGVAVLWFGLAWLGPSLLTGLAEELAFRGYLLQVLTRGCGFRPALIITSVAFGLLHITNTGEGFIGVVSVMLAGAILGLGVRRTGSLWWSIGLHGAWDYAENFLWGAPDSGQVCLGTLLRTTAQGPAFLSGGATGPEGSLLALPMLLAALFLVWRSPKRGLV